MTETVPTVLESIGTIVTAGFGWLGTAFSTAASHTEMYIPLGIGIVGAAIGLFKRSVKVGGSRRR